MKANSTRRERLAISAACAVSAAFSAAYYYTWLPRLPFEVHGVTLYGAGLAFAAGLAVLDLNKGSAVRAAARFWRERRFLQCIFAAAVSMVLVGASFWAVDGLLIQLRVAEAGEATASQKAWDRAETAYQAATAELTTLGSVRSPAEVRASMETAAVNRRTFADTTECTKITSESDRRACRPITALRVEMATAIRAEDLISQRDEAKSFLDRNERPAAGDAQAEALSRLLGIPASTVILALCWLIGLGIEGVASFGPAWVERGERSVDLLGQSDFPANVPADHPITKDGPTGGSNIRQFPKRPNGSPNGSNKQKVLAAITTDIALNRNYGSQAELAERFGMPPSTLSEWMKEWEAAGLIPERRTVGRCKVMTSA